MHGAQTASSALGIILVKRLNVVYEIGLVRSSTYRDQLYLCLCCMVNLQRKKMARRHRHNFKIFALDLEDLLLIRRMLTLVKLRKVVCFIVFMCKESFLRALKQVWGIRIRDYSHYYS